MAFFFFLENSKACTFHGRSQESLSPLLPGRSLSGPWRSVLGGIQVSEIPDSPQWSARPLGKADHTQSLTRHTRTFWCYKPTARHTSSRPSSRFLGSSANAKSSAYRRLPPHCSGSAQTEALKGRILAPAKPMSPWFSRSACRSWNRPAWVRIDLWNSIAVHFTVLDNTGSPQVMNEKPDFNLNL